MGATKNLVLGGSGTIGTALCRHLSGLGETVINLDLKNGFDLRTQSLDEYVGVDYVWFLAWEVGGAKYLSNPANQYRILSDNSQICSRVFSFLEKERSRAHHRWWIAGVGARGFFAGNGYQHFHYSTKLALDGTPDR